MAHITQWGDVKKYVLASLNEYDTLIKDPNWKTIVEDRQAAIVKDITDKVAASLALEVAHSLLEDETVRWSSDFGTRFESEVLGEKPGDFPGPDIHDNPLGHPYWYEVKTKSGKDMKDIPVGSFTIRNVGPELEGMDEISKNYWGGMYKMAYKMRNLLFVYATAVPKWPDKSRVGIKIASIFTQLRLDKVAEYIKAKKIVSVKRVRKESGRVDIGIEYNYSIKVNIGGGEKLLDIRSLYLSEFKFVDNFNSVESIRKAFFAALTRMGFTYTGGKWEKYV